MDVLLQFIPLLIGAVFLYLLVQLIRRSSRQHPLFRWFWLITLPLCSFLLVIAIAASIPSGVDVHYSCLLRASEPENFVQNAFCDEPETLTHVGRSLWIQSLTPPSMRSAEVCWMGEAGEACRYGYKDTAWGYYLFQNGLGLACAFFAGAFVWYISRDTRKQKEKGEFI